MLVPGLGKCDARMLPRTLDKKMGQTKVSISQVSDVQIRRDLVSLEAETIMMTRLYFI